MKNFELTRFFIAYKELMNRGIQAQKSLEGLVAA
jgi:hypothetical protein